MTDIGILEIALSEYDLRTQFLESLKYYKNFNGLGEQTKLESFRIWASKRGIVLRHMHPEMKFRLHQKVHEFKRTGSFMEEEALYERTIEVYPFEADFLHVYGWVLLSRNESKKAESLFLRALNIKPNDAYFTVSAAITLERNLKFSAASNLYLKAIDLNSRDLKVLRYFVSSFINRVCNVDAVDTAFRTILEIDPYDHEAHLEYIKVLCSLEKNKEAIEVCKHALELHRLNVDLLNEYCLLLEKTGHLETAEQFYRRAINMDSSSAKLLFNYSLFLCRKKNDLEMAFSVCKRLFDVDIDRAEGSAFYEAIICEEKGNIQEANMFYRTVLGTKSVKMLVLYCMRVIWHAGNSHRDRAEAMLNILNSLVPERSVALSKVVAGIQQLIKTRVKLDKANALFTIAARIEPEFNDIFLPFGKLFQKNDNHIEAIGIGDDPKRYSHNLQFLQSSGKSNDRQFTLSLLKAVNSVHKKEVSESHNMYNFLLGMMCSRQEFMV
jgi:tetratricopeptide (TPR) repeat protein